MTKSTDTEATARVVKMTCPACKGNGRLPVPLSRRKEFIKATPKRQKAVTNAIMAKLLRKEGYSLREIAAFLGYLSPRSVQLCLEREN